MKYVIAFSVALVTWMMWAILSRDASAIIAINATFWLAVGLLAASK